MVNAKVTANGDNSADNTAILPVAKRIVGVNIRILLVDDSHTFREALKQYLAPQPDFLIVGSVDNAQTAIEQVKTLNPDIILMDLEMPGMNGLQATKVIAQQFTQTKVIVLSSHDEEKYINQVLNIGAKGYLFKNTPIEELAHSIRFVHQRDICSFLQGYGKNLIQARRQSRQLNQLLKIAQKLSYHVLVKYSPMIGRVKLRN